MDNDMATLDAKFGVQQRLIQAVAKTQSEHTALLRDHTARLTRLEPGLEQVEGKLDLVHVGVQAIHTLLTGLVADPADAGPDALPGISGECR